MGNLKSKTAAVEPVIKSTVVAFAETAMDPTSLSVVEPPIVTSPPESVVEPPTQTPEPITEPVKLLDKPKKGKHRRSNIAENRVSLVKPVEFEVTAETSYVAPTPTDVVVTEIPKCRQDTAVDDELISDIQAEPVAPSSDDVEQPDVKSDADV
jgi:hypothetical protein